MHISVSSLTKRIELPFFWLGIIMVIGTPLLDYVATAFESNFLQPHFPDFDITQHGLSATFVGLIGLYLYTQGLFRRLSAARLGLYFFLTLWLLFWMPCLCAVGRVKLYLILLFSSLNFGYFLLRLHKREKLDRELKE